MTNPEGGVDLLVALNAVRIARWLPDGRKIPARTKAVLYALATRAPYIFPGQETLAADAGVSRATLNRHLDQIEEAGFITRRRRPDGATTVYLLQIERLMKAGTRPPVSPDETQRTTTTGTAVDAVPREDGGQSLDDAGI